MNIWSNKTIINQCSVSFTYTDFRDKQQREISVEELRKLKLSRFHSDNNSAAIHKLLEEFKQILNLD